VWWTLRGYATIWLFLFFILLFVSDRDNIIFAVACQLAWLITLWFDHLITCSRWGMISYNILFWIYVVYYMYGVLYCGMATCSLLIFKFSGFMLDGPYWVCIVALLHPLMSFCVGGSCDVWPPYFNLDIWSCIASPVLACRSFIACTLSLCAGPSGLWLSLLVWILLTLAGHVISTELGQVRFLLIFLAALCRRSPGGKTWTL